MRKLGRGARELGMMGGWWLEEERREKVEGGGGGEREERRHREGREGEGKKGVIGKVGGQCLVKTVLPGGQRILHTSVVSLCTVMVLPLAVTLVTQALRKNIKCCKCFGEWHSSYSCIIDM